MVNNCHIFVQALLILVLLCFTSIKAAPQKSLITSLPGFAGKFPSRHYSGYVSIGDNVAKQMFYYFVESERNPENDPLILWLNGGPGCSSLGGFAYEHGPFMFEASDPFTSTTSSKKEESPAKLHLNPFSLSKVSNIIYLDSPIGVGFSYSLNVSDYKTEDLKTAFETHLFLLKWFEMFPERLDNPFYIAGESYAGIYIPTLAFEIVKGGNSSSRPIINLKGYMIGNGVTDSFIDKNAVIPFAHGKGLISDELYQDIHDECQGLYFKSKLSSKKCASKISKFYNITVHLNLYNILDPCFYQFAPSYRCHTCIRGSTLDSNIKKSCQGNLAINSWFNHEEVRKAIHAAKERVSGKWDLCTNMVTYQRTVQTTIKYHKELMTMGLRVLIYSGDLDMVVPYTGSQTWTRSLGYKIIDEWRPWISNAQIAGFTQGYDKNLTFLTVKGAGHIVPVDKPRETLDFYTRWLAGKII